VGLLSNSDFQVCVTGRGATLLRDPGQSELGFGQGFQGRLVFGLGRLHPFSLGRVSCDSERLGDQFGDRLINRLLEGGLGYEQGLVRLLHLQNEFALDGDVVGEVAPRLFRCLPAFEPRLGLLEFGFCCLQLPPGF